MSTITRPGRGRQPSSGVSLTAQAVPRRPMSAVPHVTQSHDRQRLLGAGSTIFDVVLPGGLTGGAISLLDQTDGPSGRNR